MSLHGGEAAERVLSDWSVSRPQQMLHAAQFASCDGDIGPSAFSCRHGRFGFTLTFEQLFLSILPSTIFLTASLIQIGLLLGRKPKVATTLVQYTKLVSKSSCANHQMPVTALTACLKKRLLVLFLLLSSLRRYGSGPEAVASCRRVQFSLQPPSPSLTP